MRIVHVITRLIVGGAQENTLLSCRGQHRLGHSVTLLTGGETGPEGSLLSRALSEGYDVRIVPSLRRNIHPRLDARVVDELAGVFRRLQPDVVHTHSSKAGIVGRWAAHRARVPRIVHTIHGLAFTASGSRTVNKVYEFLERRTAPITDRIVCVAKAMRDQSLAARIGSPAQYAIVYSGMETEAFLHPPVSRDEVRARLGIHPDDVVVGTIARLFYMKGHDDLLESARWLCATHPKIKFLWVGDGILRERFERRIGELGLKDHFVLTGLVAPVQIPELVNAMDILVHPSRREGLARALPQGSLAGVPVVTYDVDGNREALVEGVSGYAVPAFDVRQLVQRVAELAGEPQRRREMGQAGRAFALKRFGVDTMVESLEQVYASIGRSPRRNIG
jgi:glycosyltransferase involved in cell wall biosynthesis